MQAIWAISASPMIMGEQATKTQTVPGHGCLVLSIQYRGVFAGNDMRNVSDASKAILKNKDAIKISQDSLGQMGIRIVRAKTTILPWILPCL